MQKTNRTSIQAIVDASHDGNSIYQLFRQYHWPGNVRELRQQNGSVKIIRDGPNDTLAKD